MKRKFIGRFAIGLFAAAAASAILVANAAAHNGNAQISCTSVTFNYNSFSPTGTNLIDHETITVDGNQVVSKSFSFNGPSGSDSVSINVGPGTHTVVAHADWTVDGGGSFTTTKRLYNCVPPCPPGKKANFRWHYSDNNTSGSWSGTRSVNCPGSLDMGPQAMEGDLKSAPGSTLKAGYSFTFPGNKSSFSVTVMNPKVVFTVRCVSGATPSSSTLTVPMPTQTYSVTNDRWYPSGDQHSSLVYQGSITVPDLCNGGRLRLDKGGTFTADVG